MKKEWYKVRRLDADVDSDYFAKGYGIRNCKVVAGPFAWPEVETMIEWPF